VQYVQILTFIYVKLMKVIAKNNLIVSKVYPHSSLNALNLPAFKGLFLSLSFFLLSGASATGHV